MEPANTETLSPEAQALLSAIRAQGFSGWAFMTIPQLRAMMIGLPDLAGETNFAGAVEEARISEDVTALIYRQPSAPPAPLLLYFHPGGFVAGDAQSIDGCARRLAHATGMSVASVNYRLAPEHKFPAALEDAYAAVQWAANRGAEFGWDPQRIIVGGDSAGGNLSAAVCQLARERSGPRLSAQLLVGALLDHDVSTESHRAFGSDFGTLTSRDVDWFLSHYVNSADELSDPRVSPLRASDLSVLPPAVIIVGAPDPLRDEAVRYAERSARLAFTWISESSRGCFMVSGSHRAHYRKRERRWTCCAEPTESVGGALKPECATSDRRLTQIGPRAGIGRCEVHY